MRYDGTPSSKSNCVGICWFGHAMLWTFLESSCVDHFTFCKSLSSARLVKHYLTHVQISGIGGGGSFMTAYVITSDMYSLRDRGLTQGISNIFNGVSFFPLFVSEDRRVQY